MEVRSRTSTRILLFGDLVEGRTFISDGDYYIKLPTYRDGSNALRLDTETLSAFLCEDEIVPVKGYFQETDG